MSSYPPGCTPAIFDRAHDSLSWRPSPHQHIPPGMTLGEYLAQVDRRKRVAAEAFDKLRKSLGKGRETK